MTKIRLSFFEKRRIGSVETMGRRFAIALSPKLGEILRRADDHIHIGKPPPQMAAKLSIDLDQSQLLGFDAVSKKLTLIAPSPAPSSMTWESIHVAKDFRHRASDKRAGRKQISLFM